VTLILLYDVIPFQTHALQRVSIPVAFLFSHIVAADCENSQKSQSGGTSFEYRCLLPELDSSDNHCRPLSS
jgi:hypothetical protein